MKRTIAWILALLLLTGCGAAQTPEATTQGTAATTLPAETTYPIPEVTVCTQEQEPWTPIYNYFESRRNGDGSGLAQMAPAEYWRGRCMGYIGSWNAGAEEARPDTMEKWQAWFEAAHGSGKDGYARICGENYTIQVVHDGYSPVSEELLGWYRQGLESMGIAGERMTEVLRLKDLKVVLTGSLGEHVEDFGNTNNFVIKVDGRWYWAGVYMDGPERWAVEFAY